MFSGKKCTYFYLNKIFIYRNSPVLCDVFPQLNLDLWKTDSPALQVPEAILIQTLEKGTQGLILRRKEEYKLWEHSKCRTKTGDPRPRIIYNLICIQITVKTLVNRPWGQPLHSQDRTRSP